MDVPLRLTRALERVSVFHVFLIVCFVSSYVYIFLDVCLMSSYGSEFHVFVWMCVCVFLCVCVSVWLGACVDVFPGAGAGGFDELDSAPR